NHHTMMRRLAAADHSVLVLNLVLLLCIVALPFSTSLIAGYLDDPDGGRLAAVVYAGSFFVTSAVFLALQRHILLHRTHLLRAQLPPAGVRRLLLRASAAPPAYLVAALAGLVTPYLTLAVCVVMGLFYLVAPPRVGDAGRAGEGE